MDGASERWADEASSGGGSNVARERSKGGAC